MTAEPQSDAQRYYDVLKRIAREYMTPEQCVRAAEAHGCSPGEMMEMTFENIQHEAEIAIKGKRRPKS